jgi:hypothetical protein
MFVRFTDWYWYKPKAHLVPFKSNQFNPFDFWIKRPLTTSYRSGDEDVNYTVSTVYFSALISCESREFRGTMQTEFGRPGAAGGTSRRGWWRAAIFSFVLAELPLRKCHREAYQRAM